MNITNNINYHFTINIKYEFGFNDKCKIFTKKLLYNNLLKYVKTNKEGIVGIPISVSIRKKLKYNKNIIDIDLLVDLLIKYCSTNVDIMYKNYNYYQKPNFNLIKN